LCCGKKKCSRNYIDAARARASAANNTSKFTKVQTTDKQFSPTGENTLTEISASSLATKNVQILTTEEANSIGEDSGALSSAESGNNIATRSSTSLLEEKGGSGMPCILSKNF
jgi:hypothetical protein